MEKSHKKWIDEKKIKRAKKKAERIQFEKQIQSSKN